MNTLKAEKRDLSTKAKKLRREGYVTGNLFGREMKESIPLKMEKGAVDRLLKEEGKGGRVRLDVEGQVYDTLIKEVDYNALKGQVDEIDFQALGERAFKERSFLVEGRRRHRRRAVPGEGEVAEELRRMENLSPVEYLSHLQGGTRPAEPDVRLVDRLSRGMGLPSPVINALMNHLVVHYDGMIPASLAEKIAGSLLRNGIESAMDAVDYLNSTRGRGKKDRAEENPLPKAAPPKEEPPEEEEEMSDEEALERGLVKDDKAKRGQRRKKKTDAEPDVEPDAETDEAES